MYYLLLYTASCFKSSSCCANADYRLFCEILVQRPIKRHTVYLPSRMSESDLAYMRKMAQDHFDQIMKVLKDMPRCLLLVIRWGEQLFRQAFCPFLVINYHNPCRNVCHVHGILTLFYCFFRSQNCTLHSVISMVNL